MMSSMEEAGFEEIRVYIKKIQNMVPQYIATQSLLDLCEASDRKQGEQVGMRWQE